MPETYGTDDSFCGRLNPWAQAFFGPLPALTEPVSLVMSHQLHQSDRIWSQWQVRVGQPTWLTWTLHRVDPAGVFCPPLLLSPDGCWPHVLHSDAMAAVVGQGVALAWFNRTELAFDAPSCTRQGPVQDRWPEVPWSALSVWAWGLMTCANALSQAEDRGFGKLGAVGHSRGGKAALLAALLNKHFATSDGAFNPSPGTTHVDLSTDSRIGIRFVSMLIPPLSKTGPPSGETTRHLGPGCLRRCPMTAAACSMSWVIATLAA